MSNIVKCQRCASNVDVTSFAPGSSVRCSDCGGMMRVPTGRTGVQPAVKERTATRPGTAAVGAAPKKERGTSTRMRAAAAADKRESATRMRQAAAGRAAPPKKSSTGLYVLLGIAALALIVGGAFFFLGTPKADPPEPTPMAKPLPSKPLPPPKPAPAPAPAPAPVDAPPAPPPPPSGDEAARTKWEDILIQLRGGGGYDIPGRPEQVYYEKVKKMGKSAYPHLIKFIDNDDPALGRAAVAVLNELTGQKKPLPNDATKAKLKAEWEAWLKANP